MAIGTGAGGSASLFGHLDYYNAIGSGSTNQAVLAFINSNFDKLSKGTANQPGGGGLYDQIYAGAQREKEAEQARQLREQENSRRQAEIARQEQLQIEAENRQVERLKQMEIGARTQAANVSRAGLQSAFQIKSQSKSPKTAGTQGFKRRKLQVNPAAYSSVASGSAANTSAQTKSSGVINV